MSLPKESRRIDDKIEHLIRMVREHAPLDQILRHRCPECGAELKIEFANAGIDFNFQCEGNFWHFSGPCRVDAPPPWWKSCFEEWVETTFHYVGSAEARPDGSLCIGTSTYGYAYHASGVMFIFADDPDLPFWRWCVDAVPDKDKFYNEEQLAEFRDQYIALFPNAPRPRRIVPRKQFDNASASCTRCLNTFSRETVHPADFSVLQIQHEFYAFSKERDWLLRVADFYRRHPDCEGRIRPAYVNLLETGNLVERARFLAKKTLDEFDLSVLEVSSPNRDWSAEDLEVISYLQHHGFTLQPRLQFVTDKFNELRPCVESSDVPCPECGGRLEWDVVE